METPFSIRDARAEDLPSLAALEWANARPLLDIPRDEEGFKADCLAHLRKSLEEGAPLLVCEDAEGLAGFCCCSFPPGATDMLSFDSVQVSPRRQKQGLATLLTDSLLWRLRTEGRVCRLLVKIRRDSPAVALYRSLGFVEMESFSATHFVLEFLLRPHSG
ncbi:MAG: hypothetical protein A2X49_15265 [Lentisphaerae bacterium GWF2_52_8]|nr:MAG: hypothetical protein A2X49_15265 [Lentisphaerae bacterium GWF2_52_8]